MKNVAGIEPGIALGEFVRAPPERLTVLDQGSLGGGHAFECLPFARELEFHAG